MAEFTVTVNARAWKHGFLAAIEELKGEVDLIVETTGEKGAELARGFAPKRTGRLAESIHVTPLGHSSDGPFCKVIAGGEGIREVVFTEFGTYKDPAQSYMRRSAAMLAGGLRGAGYGARAVTSQRTRLLARRMRARAVVREQRRGGLLSAGQARQVSRALSNRLRVHRRRKR